jgi:hypothetical protein
MSEPAQIIENDATPERLAHANDNSVIIDGVRHFQDGLLHKLASKNQLYPDTNINAAMFMAGEKYYADWYGSQMSNLGAIDYGAVTGGGGGGASQMPASHKSAVARASYRQAREAIGKKYREVVELIILEDQTDLVGIGAKVTGTSTAQACRAVAIERFTAGLFLLAKHYGYTK